MSKGSMYGSRWNKARTAFLRERPLCVDCEGRGMLKAATVVDHIIPHKGDMGLFWDTDNWAGLCASCHNRKTAMFDGGFGNKGGKLQPGCDVDGMPSDGRHHWR